MPTIPVSRQLLDKHFISAAIGKLVTEFRIRKGNKTEDSLASNLISLDVRLSTGEILNLLYKCMNPEPHPFSISLSSPETQLHYITEGYSIEIQFYQFLAPLLSQVANEALPIPKLYSASESNDGLEAYLILEDFRPLGFKPGNKYNGLTLEEVQLVMQTIAKFHAQSYILLKCNDYGKTLFTTEKTQVFLEKHPFNTRKGIDLAPHIEALYAYAIRLIKCKRSEALAERMEKFHGICYNTVIELWEKVEDYDESEDTTYFPVINHGDLWVDNILFWYEDGFNSVNKMPKEVKFIDFQQCRRGSIYEDLLYFFLTSTSPSFRAEHLDSCLQSYFQNFSSTLNQLGVQLPAKFCSKSLINSFKENLPAGFCHLVFAMPFQLGIFAPPQSPATPSVNESGFKDFELDTKTEVASEKSMEAEIENALMSFVESLKHALKNSYQGLNRLESIVEEMVHLGVL